MKQITHVAIKYNGVVYSLPAPNRHHNVIRLIGGVYGSDIQGFLDEEGVFLNRREAYVLAVKYITVVLVLYLTMHVMNKILIWKINK